MLNVVIFGAPGSGKGTQSELIIKEYGLDHISTGDVLRGEMKAESRLDVYHTQTAPLADYYVGEGKHVAIKGMGTIEEIFGRIKEAVNNVK